MQVSLAHVSLRYICKLLLAGVVAGAALPGIVYSCTAPPLTAVLLIIQVGTYLILARLLQRLIASKQESAGQSSQYPAAQQD